MKKQDLIGTLQMQLKAAQHKINDYESGKRYQMIEENHRKSRRHDQRIIEQKNARIRELVLCLRIKMTVDKYQWLIKME